MENVKKIIEQLTLQEKVGLLSGKNAWSTLDIERLKIPNIHLNDGPHGLRKPVDETSPLDKDEIIPATCFPPAATAACSFNRQIIEKMGQAIASECLKENVQILLGPGINIKRSPLGGRNFEYYSEDPYLAGEMGISFVKGVQSQGVGACLKHFAVNSQESYRFSYNALVDQRALREIYLEAFRKVVQEAKPYTIMASYNKINGEYGCENKELLTTILRDEWGFKGLVVSDWGGVNERVKGLQAGLDLEMPSSHSYNDNEVLQAVNNQTLDIKVVDKTVLRLLELINLVKDSKPVDFNQNHNHQVAYEVAKESFVLLKNDGILPLSVKDDFIVVGDLASKPHIQGLGSSKVHPFVVNTPLSELQQKKKELAFYSGYSANEVDNIALRGQAIAAVRNAKIVVLFVGLTDEYEAEGVDRKTLALPENQLQLLEGITKVNQNVIVVLQGGSVMDLGFEPQCRAILQTFLMGQAGGRAVAEMLLGEVSPSGKLAETIPMNLHDTPCYKYFTGGIHNVYYAESIYVGYRYYDSYKLKVRYPFGHGLSYSTFAFKNERLLQNNETFVYECDITNTGQYVASEVIQVYIRNKSKKDFYAYQELKGFEKVQLNIAETKHVSIVIPIKEMKYYDVNSQQFEVETGDYEIAIGTSSRDIYRVYPVSVKGSIERLRQEGNNCYSKKIEFNDNDFRKLLGLVILPPTTLANDRPYHLNTTFKEVEGTLIGKFLYKTASQKTSGEESILGARANKEMLDFIVMRWIGMMGGESFTMEQAKGVVDLLNHKFVRGLRSLNNKKGVELNGKK